MKKYKLSRVLLAFGCLASILILSSIPLLSGCGNLHTVTYKWDANTGRLVEATYADDTGWHFFSNGSGKTISIAPSVNGIGL